jgi:regulator of protease activity HflC (stomatin/prohibitin superfamily)
VLFWVVTDARKAIVEVEHYAATVSWAAQTTLRDVIGHTELVGMISDREQVDGQLQEILDAKTSDWGITVMSVEIRDVRLPGMLEDAMSRKTQADRESEARVILAHSELAVADEMEQAMLASPDADDWCSSRQVARELRGVACDPLFGEGIGHREHDRTDEQTDHPKTNQAADNASNDQQQR